MLQEKNGKMRNDFVTDYVVFDLETTGISCISDKVIEISAVKVQNHKVTEEFSSLVNPERNIPPAASMVNQITDDMVADAPVFEEVLPRFLDFIEDYVLVGHNIHSFDLKFINRDCVDYYGKLPSNDYVDTLALARVCLPELSRYKLTDLAKYYHISSDGAHRALNDCRMNQKIYELLGEKMTNSSITVPKCPKCGSVLIKRKGKFGEFFGCSGYPGCRYTRNL